MKTPPLVWLRTLVAPRRAAESALLKGDGWTFLGFTLLIEMLYARPMSLGRHLGVATYDLIGGLAGLANAYVSWALTPLVFTALGGLALHALLRRSGRRLSDSFTLVCYAWAPHLLLVSVSAALSQVSLPPPWWIHRPVAVGGSGMAWLVVLASVPSYLYLWFLVHGARQIDDSTTPWHWTSRGKMLAAALATIVGVGVIAGGAHIAQSWDNIRPTMPDSTSPKFVVESLKEDGRKLTHASLAGQVTLIDFWATWCGPCVAAMPDLIDLHKKYQGQGLTVLSLNVEPHNRAAVEQFVTTHALPFEVWTDRGSARRAFKVNTYPSVFVVDRTGVIRYIHVGTTASSTLDSEIKSLLAE